jgi:toxin secretion/phage lysis holin
MFFLSAMLAAARSQLHSRIVELMLLSVVMDLIFGSLRALKEHKLNSSVGIDGAIRKVGMIAAVVCLAFMDVLAPFDLAHFVPKELKEVLKINDITIMELFSLLFAIFEALSVLKNMTLSGLPVRNVWERLHSFLSKNTGELLDLSEIDEAREEEHKGENGSK